MPLYFMLHDAERFHRLLRPALGASWRERSFGPCVAIRTALEANLTKFLSENRIGREKSLLVRVGPDTPFDRALWRFLVGEVLLVGAAEIPEIQLAPETLCCLLSPGCSLEMQVSRTQYTLIEQAFRGARDLIFGGGCYRPDHAGYNDQDNVLHIANFLSKPEPEHWEAAQLACLLENEEEQIDELQFARAGLAELRKLYEGAQARSQIIVCEGLCGEQMSPLSHMPDSIQRNTQGE
jgi:hypothetical protein